MLDAFSRNIINRRPKIKYISPKSVDTIPEPSPSELEPEKPARIQALIDNFKKLDATASVIQDLLAERAKGEVLVFNLDDPEDFATAQATARVFPDCGEEIEGIPGLKVCKTITFEKFRRCVEILKEHGVKVGQQNQIPAVTPGLKTDFGQVGQDRRPQINKMSSIIPPVPIPAYLIATIPLLFLMLHPLRSLYVNSKIAGHLHNVTAPGAPSGPGLPVNPT